MLAQKTSIRIQENCLGYGSTIGTMTKPGIFLYADSEALNVNWEEVDRSGKLVGQRVGDASVLSYSEYAPAGNLSFQPRFNDLAMILMAHFQVGTFRTQAVVAGVGTVGTFWFVPFEDDPDLSGTLIGTAEVLPNAALVTGAIGTRAVSQDIYPINVDIIYCEQDSSTVNGKRFTRGIVNTLEFNQVAGEDFKITPSFLFKDVIATFLFGGAGTLPPSNAFGTLSTWEAVIPGYRGTVSFSCAGVGFSDILQSCVFTSDWGIESKKGIGVKGLAKPAFGQYSFSGNFECEFLRPDLYQPKDTGTLSVEWNTQFGKLAFYCPDIRFTPFESNIGGAGVVYHSPTFKAYKPFGGGTSAITVMLAGTFSGRSMSLIHSGTGMVA